MSPPIDPILIDVPARIETARLVLRCPAAGDGLALYAAVLESMDELRPWMHWAQAPPSPEASEIWCRRQQAAFLLRQDLPMLMFERAIGGSGGTHGRLLGACGLHRIDWRARRFELGYWARRGHNGQGYVTEAVRALTRMAFERLGAQRLELRMDELNEASQRVAEAAGYEFEALLHREKAGVDGTLRDTRVYARMPPKVEWRASADQATAGDTA